MMPQFAYVGRESAGTASGVPSGWPFGWIYPGDSESTPYPTSRITAGAIPGIPWPTGWPITVSVGTTVTIDVPVATILYSLHAATVECYIKIGASESAASVYNRHLLQVTVSEAGVARRLRKSGGAAYQDAIFYQVSNYAGNRWGFQASIDFENVNMQDLDLWDIEGKLVTAIANPSGVDQWQVLS